MSSKVAAIANRGRAATACSSSYTHMKAIAVQTHRLSWKTLLAFGIIYFVWGSTFLAIRVGVREVPPFLLAAMRFLAAGLILYAWTTLRGERSPSARQWGSVFLIAMLIFVFDYGLLF